MTVKTQEHPQLHFVKTVAKWVYYASTMFIMLGAFDLYYEDIEREDEKIKKLKKASSTPIYPWILVVLNMVVIVMIWCHFTYQKKRTILVTVAVIVGLLVYRFMIALHFNWLYNLPNIVAISSGLTWMVCDKLHHEEADLLDGRNDSDSSSPASSSPATSEATSTPNSSLDAAEKGQPAQ